MVLHTGVVCNMLERCLKTGLHIIFQEQYLSFSHCLKLANLSSLKKRRAVILAKFSKNALSNPKYKKWFCAAEEPTEAGSRPLLKPVQCRTQRFERSPIPVMTRLLSWHPPLPYTPPNLAWICWNCPAYIAIMISNYVLLVITLWWLIIVCGYFALVICCSHSDMSTE